MFLCLYLWSYCFSVHLCFYFWELAKFLEVKFEFRLFSGPRTPEVPDCLNIPEVPVFYTRRFQACWILPLWFVFESPLRLHLCVFKYIDPNFWILPNVCWIWSSFIQIQSKHVKVLQLILVRQVPKITKFLFWCYRNFGWNRKCKP